MSPSLRYYDQTSGAWEDIATVGAQGAPGPPGATGPDGLAGLELLGYVDETVADDKYFLKAEGTQWIQAGTGISDAAGFCTIVFNPPLSSIAAIVGTVLGYQGFILDMGTDSTTQKTVATCNATGTIQGPWYFDWIAVGQSGPQ